MEMFDFLTCEIVDWQLGRHWHGWDARESITCIDVLFSVVFSELDQSNVTEENPEGEEHPPADSENK